MRATDLFGGPFTPVGFYYKTFIRPRRLWPLYEKVLRHAAGLGALRKRQDEREWRTEYRRRHADVLVVGGGAAGLSAAIAAARAGRRRRARRRGPRAGRARCSPRAATSAPPSSRREARAAGVELLTGAAALGCFDGLVPVWQGATLHQVRAAAARLRDRHDRAAARLRRQRPARGSCSPAAPAACVARYAVAPGRRARSSPRPATAAGRRARRCAPPACESPPSPTCAPRREPRASRAALEAATAPSARRPARWSRPRAARALSARACSPRSTRRGGERSDRLRPARRLRRRGAGGVAALQAGARTRYDAARGPLRARRAAAGAHAAGELAGPRARDGRAVGRGGGPRGRARPRARRRTPRARASAAQRWSAPRSRSPSPPAVSGAGARQGFVDLDEDVTVKDVAPRDRRGLRLDGAGQALHDGHDGPVAGPLLRRCAMARLMAAGDRAVAARRRADDGAPAVGRRCRWACSPAARSSRPSARRSTAATASSAPTVMWAGDWRRAYDYGDPQGEAIAVHDGRRPDRRLDARQAARAAAPRPARSSTACTPTASRTSSPGASATA